MNLNITLKNTIEDLLNYFNNDCLLNIKINDRLLKINSEDVISNIDINSLFLIDKIVQNINTLRQDNQSQLALKKFDTKIFASTEIILSAANEAFKKVKAAFEKIKFLKDSNSFESTKINMNDKFVVRKIAAYAQRILSKFENLPERLITKNEIKDLLVLLKKITLCEDIGEILGLTREILIRQNVILKPDYFVDYNALIDEYGWVHDVVKLSSANAEFMGLIVDVEIYTNVVKEWQYVPSAIRV
ncbi:hypothetical protein [Spiroplasma taiwanense]|uniref:Uncharacterized protein n=1 Tax=Spiroplasma taiwanense CT-1 TaxID=1276220 RepID=S5MCV5_9MOLU|nr:hypothetical protein [Spiroplasma taiwanense]AGR41558.1 hypothetical protein STAIW_v1c09720 [Spiroplasma taiwanense CT-1]